MTGRAATGWWTNLRGRLILLALVGFTPLFGLAVYQAIGSRQQALAGGYAVATRPERHISWIAARSASDSPPEEYV